MFLDIITARRCYCRWCLEGMQAAGLDPANDADADEYARRVLHRYFERTTAACRLREPEMRVFHNSGHVGKSDRGERCASTRTWSSKACRPAAGATTTSPLPRSTPRPRDFRSWA